MDTLELIQRLSVSLAAGLVIGLERGWQQRAEAEGERAAGLRTHALAGLLGGVWGALAAAPGNGGGGAVALGLAFVVFAAVLATFRWRETEREGTRGMTTVVAGMLAFALGALAVAGNMQAAAAGAVATAGLLSLKPALHAWLKRLSWAELRSALVLLAMTFILLPLLPRRTVDPWQSLNPFEIWLMTILIAAISFAGYVALKLAGTRKGMLLTGIAGGLASSTMVTVTSARLARDHPAHRGALMGGAAIAGATMIGRVLAVAVVTNPELAGRLVLPLVMAGGALAAYGLWTAFGAEPDATAPGTIPLTNPFELPTVLQFGALLALVSALAKVLTAAFGSGGAYMLALVSGIADVDALTLSMARLGKGEIGIDVAANAILVVVAVNTTAKAVLAGIAGGRDAAAVMAAAAALAIGAGGLGVLVQLVR